MGKALCFLGCLLSLLGTAIIGLGFIAAYVVVPMYVQTTIQNELIVSPSSYTDGKSNDTAADATPVYESYYVFNILNPDDVMTGENPIVEELGPFVYRKYSFTYDAKFNDDETEYSSRSWSQYVFQADRSNSTDDVEVTAINPAYVGGLLAAGGENTLGMVVMGGYMGQTYSTLLDPDSIGQLMAVAHGAHAVDVSVVLNAASCTPALFLSRGCSTMHNLPKALAEGKTETDVTNIWQSTTMTGFNGVTWTTWMKALTSGTDQATNIGLIMTGLSLTLEDFGTVADWVGTKMLAYVSPPAVCAAMSGGTECTADAMVKFFIRQQWNKQAFIKGSINPYVDAIKDYPAWEIGTTTTPAFTDDALVKALIENEATTLGDRTNLVTFLTWYGAFKNAATKAAAIDWFTVKYPGLDTTADTELDKIVMQYFGYNGGVMMSAFSLSAKLNLFDTWTVHEVLFGRYDVLTGSYIRIANNRTEEPEPTDDANSVFYTGKSDIEKVKSFVKFQGETTLKKWYGEPITFEGCTEGAQWAPFEAAPGPDRCLLVSDLMRPVTMVSNDDEFDVKGIKTTEYRISDDSMASAAKNPDNAVYNQIRQGMVNLTPVFSSPMFMSKPHCLGCDDTVLSTITGFTPDAKVHETSIYNILLMGATIKANERLQLNVFTDVTFDADGVNKLVKPGQIFPVMWVERDSELTDDQADDLKALLDLISLIVLMCIVIGTAVGGILIMIGACCMIAHKKSGSRAKVVPIGDMEMEKRR